MRKTTFLFILLFVLTGGKAMADNYHYDADNGGLPGALSQLEGSTEKQYSWTSPVITAPTGFTTLRVSFADNSQHDISSSDYPFVCISEFYLYDKSGTKVPLTVDKFSTNAQQPGEEGPMANICDGNTSNSSFWHSIWSAKVGAPHYLEVTMPNGDYDLTQFSFGWVTRRQAGAPTEILVTTGTSHEDVETQITPITLNYHYMYGTTEWFTDEKLGLPMCHALPVPTQVYGVNVTAPGGIIYTELETPDINITCELTEDIPFQFSNSYAEVNQWYFVAIAASKHYLRYDEGDEYIPLNVSDISNISDKNAYRWAFVGNPYTGFEIYNLKAGSGKILSSSAGLSDGNTGGNTFPILTETPVPEGNMTHWDVTRSTSINGVNGFFLAHHGYGSHRMNQRSGKLAYWTDGANAGSTFQVEPCPTLAVYTSTRNALLAPFDELSHVSNICSATELAAARKTISDAIDKIKNDKNLTSQSTLDDFYEAVQQLRTETPSKITEQLKRLVEGKCFTLKNKGRGDNNHYLTTAGPFSTIMNTREPAAYWTLQVTDEHTFLMYNPTTNTYMGHIPNENEVKVPVVVDKEDAGKFHILAPTEEDNVITFVHDLSPENPWGLHESQDGISIVRWYANATATQWAVESVSIPATSLLESSGDHCLIYHTDDNGVKHYLQIAPGGTLGMTEHPVYSFAITQGATEDGYAGRSYYLTMNNHRLSHWNGSNFNTNNIETNEEHCEGLWHSQVIYHNIKTGKYAIRSTNANTNSYDANTYMAFTENGLASISSETYENENLYQWEIRSGYPFNLTTDNADPAAYRIKTGRTINSKEWWYTYGNDDDKISLTQFTDADWKQYYWFFKEIKENGIYYLQLYPYAGEGKVISYNNTSNGADKVSGQEVNAGGYNNKWLIDNNGGHEPYGLQTSGRENYLSNHGGVTYKMGFYNSASDPGTGIYFAPFTVPADNFWEPYIGTSVGKYDIPAPEFPSDITITSYLAAVDNFYNLLNTENIVKPSAGFYRFQGKASGKYMDGTVYAGTDGGQMNMVAEQDKTNIFYLNSDNKLLNYSNGTYLQNTRATNAIGAENGSVINFFSSEGNNYGFYTMKATNSGSQYIYDNTNRVDRNSGYAKEHCDWRIEPVTSLPVTIGSAGWATFCAPVALEIPEDVTVYYATEAQSGFIIVKAIEGNVVPAGLPVLLSAEDATYTFEIHDGAPGKPADQSLEMKGTEAGKIDPVPAGQTYVLARLSQGVGFGRNNAGKIPGFKAYLEPANAETDGFSISFDDFSTGIQGVTARDLEKTEYYDLSGRRVYFPTRGIYVTNKGEKVFIK